MVKKELENGSSVVSGQNRQVAQSQGSNLAGVSNDTRTQLASYEKGYQENGNVSLAKQNLQNVQNNKPGAFSSTFQQELDNMYNQIKNRPNFTYDINGDALYQKYAEMYRNQGQQAMKDTMGQAATMTGGFGNSYVQTAGQQAYNNQMNQLNDRAMDFYQLAQDRYNAEGERLNNLYNMANDRYNTEYGQYRDKVSDYYQDYNNAYNRYSNERDFGYQQYVDMMNYWQNKAQGENTDYWNQTEFDYQKGRDAIADSQWAKEFQYQKDRDAVSDALAAMESSANVGEAYKENIKNGLINTYKKEGYGAVKVLANELANSGILDAETIAVLLDEIVDPEDMPDVVTGEVNDLPDVYDLNSLEWRLKYGTGVENPKTYGKMIKP